MNDLQTVGKIIKDIRKSSEHKTQERFAELIDTSVETVSNLERGLCLISTTTLVKIAENCNVSADEILGIGHTSDEEKGLE